MEEKAKKWVVLKEDARETQGANMSRMAPGLGERLGWGHRLRPRRGREPVGAEPPPTPSWVPATPRGIALVREGRGTGTRRVCSTRVQARTRTSMEGTGTRSEERGGPAS